MIRSVGLFSLVCTLLFACSKRKAPAASPLSCSDSISFNQQVLPFVRAHCSKCHAPNAGSPPVLSTHTEIAKHANTILGPLKGTPVLMPMGKDVLPDSLIRQFECWIMQGKQDN